MKLTVAICTWNRAKLLNQTLAAMHSLLIPKNVDWELLVVNNNCTDNTDEVLKRHANYLPLRRLFEPKQGHSNARNCATANTNGELLIWTDDDVVVDSTWLASYVDAAARWPKASYFGGLIQPSFEVSPPCWVRHNLRQLEGLLVIRDLGVKERIFEGEEQPFGANMAFRTEVLPKIRFDPNLGRNRDDCILGDETQVFRILRRQAQVGVWVPDARVQHYVPRERVRVAYLWNYFHGTGRTLIRMYGVRCLGATRWRGAPRWWYRCCGEKLCKAWAQRLMGRPEWARTYSQAAQLAGMIAEARELPAVGNGSLVSLETKEGG